MLRKFITIIAGFGMLFSPYANDDNARIGGSGLLEFGVTILDLEPVKKIVEKDLDKSSFDFDKTEFITVGIAGYAGQRRNGIRIGWGGWAGFNSTYSDVWGSLADSQYVRKYGEQYVDSVVKLTTVFMHSGLLLEKSFGIGNKLNPYAGILAGGGVLMTVAQNKPARDAFRDVNDYDDDKDNNSVVTIDNNGILIEDETEDDEYNNERVKFAIAPLWVTDIHGGLTYSLKSWMHVGVNAAATFCYSTNGFGYTSGSFAIVNPSIKLRLVFGTSA
jgi:hypothetical protein